MLDKSGQDWRIEVQEAFLPPCSMNPKANYYRVYANTTNAEVLNTFRVFSTFGSEEEATTKIMQMINLLNN